MAGHGARTRVLLAAALALALALAWLPGCSLPSPGIRKVDPATRAQALIDAGNEAFRKGEFKLAAERYASAAVVRKDDPAAWFGLGMALTRLGRDEEARAAYARARELARRERASSPR